MGRRYIRHYLMNTGPHAGKAFEGFEIGWQMYPDQIELEQLSDMTSLYANGQAIWIPSLGQRIVRKSGLGNSDITKEGVNYGDFTDLCATYDRNNLPVRLGDSLYIAVKNSVRVARVTKIADKPFFMGYGLYVRKVTVRDDEEEQTFVVNNSRDTILKV